VSGVSALPVGARVIVGTGGVGAGITLELVGNRDLGREESRPVRLLDARDYCKLHIVFHYLHRLVGQETRVLPIGRVGRDASGEALVREMADAGLTTRYITRAAEPTLYSVAFVYPDGDGGNLTTVDSASSRVDQREIRACEPELRRIPGPGIAVALPEVPLTARIELLRMATELGHFRIASFVPEETSDAALGQLLDHVDLLVVNSQEAAALCGEDAAADGAVLLARLRDAMGERPARLVLTCGLRGSWAWDGDAVSHAPAILGPVRSTAGAGDAHLAGVITGLVAGWSLQSANEFAALVSGVKVGSVHTIHPDLDWRLLERAAEDHGAALPGHDR
jgi:sugar/nucleoside kinase (ribokinase family)